MIRFQMISRILVVVLCCISIPSVQAQAAGQPAPDNEVQPQPETRAEQTEAEQSLQSEYTAALFKDLRSPYSEVRERAMFALVKAGQAIVESARKGLGDNDPRYKAACIDLLALAGDTDSLPELVALAAGEDGPALIQIKALRAIDVLDPSRGAIEKMLRGELKQPAGIVLKALKNLDPKDPGYIAWKQDLLLYRHPRSNMINRAVTNIERRDEQLANLLAEIDNFIVQGKITGALARAQAFIDKAPDSLTTSTENEYLATSTALVYSMALKPLFLSNLEKYREMFDQEARRHLQSLQEQGEKPGQLLQFLYRYRYTSYGRIALGILLEEYYEQESYNAVILTWNAFRDIHREADTASLVMVAVSYCKDGRPEDAQAMQKDIIARPDSAEIRISGVMMKTVDFLTAEIGKALSADSQSNPSESAGNFSGQTANAKLGDINLDSAVWSKHAGVLYAGARVESYVDAQENIVRLLPWEMPSDPDDKKRFLRTRKLIYIMGATPGIKYGGALPVDPYPYRPVIRGKRVVINNGNCVYCLNLADGKLIWKYDNGVDLIAQNSLKANKSVTRDTKFPNAIVVEKENAVFVVIEDRRLFEKQMAAREKGKAKSRRKKSHERSPVNAVVCLNLDTGKVRWSTADSCAGISGTWFRSAPYYTHGMIMATVSAGFNLPAKINFVNITLLAFDADTGRLLWRLPLNAWEGWGKSSVDPEQPEGMEKKCPAVLPPGATSIGSIAYILTNGGTLASVDIDSGRMLWIAKYPEFRAILPIAALHRMEIRNQGWFPKHEINLPPVVCKGKIYIMPFDSDFFMVYDMYGQMLWRARAAHIFTEKDGWRTKIHRKFSQFRIDRKGTVYLIGSEIAAYSPNGVLLWRNTDVAAAGDIVLGKDFLAVPTTRNNPRGSAVVLLDLKTGKVKTRRELDFPKLLRTRLTALVPLALSKDKDTATEAIDELIRFGGTPVVEIIKKTAQSETDEKTKEALDFLADYIERVDKGLRREPIGRLGSANLTLVKGRLLLTTHEGIIIAFGKKR